MTFLVGAVMARQNCPPELARKKWLSGGSSRGGEASAVQLKVPSSLPHPMRARHALPHTVSLSTERVRTAATTSLTLQCAPQLKMDRSRGVCMTKLKMRKAGLHHKVHPSYPQLALAAAMPPPPLRPTLGPSCYRVSQAHPNPWPCVTCRLDQPS